MNRVLRFSLPDETDTDTVEAEMALAIFAAECVYGRPRVRMEVAYLLDEEGKSCVVRVDGEAGDAAARVFVGLIAARAGEESFTVRHASEVGESHVNTQAER